MNGLKSTLASLGAPQNNKLQTIANNAKRLRDQGKLKEAAKQFEATLVNTLVNEMEKTIDQSGFVDDSQSKQIRGMYWQFMSDEISNKGGFGIAKQLYKEFSTLAKLDQQQNKKLEY